MSTIRDNTKPTIIKPQIPNIGPEDYYTTPQLKKSLEGIITVIKNIEEFGTEMGDRNYILKGPPGTGKTLGVQYIASQLGIPVYDAKNIGSAKEISALFKQLRGFENKSIVLINELDKFTKREDMDPIQRQTLNQLLDEMDGTENNNNLFFFGTTNLSNKIDSALRRTGRFSKEIEFMPPDKKGREQILNIYANHKGGHKFQIDKDLIQHASEVTFGYTPADLVGLLNETFKNALVRGSKKVIESDLEYALKETKPTAIRDMPFKEPKIKFKDIGGYETHKELMETIIGNNKQSTILIYGPPGTGKTKFTEAIAGEYGFNYLVIDGAEAEDKYVGETEKKINLYLERAKQLAPCVLLFDEIDALVEKSNNNTHKSGWTGTLQSKLSEPIDGVYLVATTNTPEVLKKAFGERFIHKMYFGLPSETEQKQIWAQYVPETINIDELVETNNHLSGRDIANTSRKLNDFGISNPEAYKQEVKRMSSKEVNYQPIIEQMGDSVEEYESIKKFIKNQGN